MKKFLLFSLLMTSLFGAHIDDFASDMGYMRDYHKAVDKAQKEHKMVMLVMVADYCPWCRKFERKTLKHISVASVVKERFVPVIMDRNLDKERYPSEYYTPLIPNVFFIDPKDERSYLKESIGYVKRKEFVQTMNEAIKTYAKEGKK